MKKLLFFISLVLLSASPIFGQSQFKAAFGGSFPTGTVATSGSGFGLNLDFTYVFQAVERIDVGITTGYSHVFGKTVGGIDFADIKFVPIAATTRFNVVSNFSIGIDLGYNLVVGPSGNDGGFYSSPKAFYRVGETISLFFAYRSFKINTASFNLISIGAEFDFD